LTDPEAGIIEVTRDFPGVLESYECGLSLWVLGSDEFEYNMRGEKTLICF
jgi:hypothetical protein